MASHWKGFNDPPLKNLFLRVHPNNIIFSSNLVLIIKHLTNTVPWTSGLNNSTEQIVLNIIHKIFTWPLFLILRQNHHNHDHQCYHVFKHIRRLRLFFNIDINNDNFSFWNFHINLCIVFFPVSFDYSPYSSAGRALFSFFMKFLLISSSFPFLQSSIISEDSVYVLYSIKLSKVFRLVFFLFSFLFLCIISSVSIYFYTSRSSSYKHILFSLPT